MKPFNLKSALNCTILAMSCMASTQIFAADAAPKAQAEASAPKTKQQLIQRLLELWHVEAVGVTMLREPVDNALRQARAALQARTTPEKRDEALKDIEKYCQELLEKLMPKVLEKSKSLAQTTVAPLLSEKFTEEELRQVIAILESPALAKFEKMRPEMQKALGIKLGEDQGKEIKPQMEELQQRIGKRMREAIES
ncbi:MAG: DUF2059 domain-containing protein [Rhodoferax sp.]|nr:DUF2059 domain-containing protein [Rhodoferax sp.]